MNDGRLTYAVLGTLPLIHIFLCSCLENYLLCTASFSIKLWYVDVTETDTSYFWVWIQISLEIACQHTFFFRLTQQIQLVLFDHFSTTKLFLLEKKMQSLYEFQIQSPILIFHFQILFTFMLQHYLLAFKKLAWLESIMYKKCQICPTRMTSIYRNPWLQDFATIRD